MITEYINYHFNSIKVRLELYVPSYEREGFCGFQFHKGAIRTWWRTPDFLRELEFQFHKGAIRTLAPQRAFHSNFLFQFHKGAIRTNVEVVGVYCPPISIP